MRENWKEWYICDNCSAHSPIKFKVCPSCGSQSIRMERFPKGYFQNAFVPEEAFLKKFSKSLRCSVCKKETLNLSQNGKILKCTNCGETVFTEVVLRYLAENHVIVFNPSRQFPFELEIFKGEES